MHLDKWGPNPDLADLGSKKKTNSFFSLRVPQTKTKLVHKPMSSNSLHYIHIYIHTAYCTYRIVYIVYIYSSSAESYNLISCIYRSVFTRPEYIIVIALTPHETRVLQLHRQLLSDVSMDYNIL